METRKVRIVFESNIEVFDYYKKDIEVFDYYKKYGKCKGFGGIRKTRKFDDDNKLKYVTYSCAKSGNMKFISSMRPNPSTKASCKVKINIAIDGDSHHYYKRSYS